MLRPVAPDPDLKALDELLVRHHRPLDAVGLQLVLNFLRQRWGVPDPNVPRTGWGQL